MNETLTHLGVKDSLVFGLGLAANPLGTFERLRERGDIVHLNLGLLDLYLINQPELIVKLTKPKLRKDTRDIRLFRAMFGEGMFTMDNTQTRRDRREVVQESFHKQKVPFYSKAADEIIEQTFNAWEQGQTKNSIIVKNLNKEVSVLTLRVAAKSLFGKSVDKPQAMKLDEAVQDLLGVFGFSMRYLSWHRQLLNMSGHVLPTLVPGSRVLGSFVKGLLEDAKEDKRSDTLLGDLIHFHKQNPHGFTADALQSELQGLFIASYVTTAYSLLWAIIEVASREDYSRRIREDGENSSFTNNCYKESLRRYPPFWLINRKTASSVKLTDNITLPADVTLMISPYSIQNDGRFWSQPEKFDPDRFTRERVQRGAYIPFGFDSRACLGAPFSMMEGPKVLAKLFSRFQVSLLNKPDPEASAVIKPKGLVEVILKSNES